LIIRLPTSPAARKAAPIKTDFEEYEMTIDGSERQSPLPQEEYEMTIDETFETTISSSSSGRVVEDN